jgi:hypothetical protein
LDKLCVLFYLLTVLCMALDTLFITSGCCVGYDGDLFVILVYCFTFTYDDMKRNGMGRRKDRGIPWSLISWRRRTRICSFETEVSSLALGFGKHPQRTLAVTPSCDTLYTPAPTASSVIGPNVDDMLHAHAKVLSLPVWVPDWLACYGYSFIYRSRPCSFLTQ